MSEQVLFERLRLLDTTEKYSYAEKGRICLLVKKQLLHENRVNPETGHPCSLTEWIRLAAPWNYSTCFSSMRDMEALSDMSEKDLAEISESNIKTLTQLSSAVRVQPAVVRAAKTQSPAQFTETIRRDHPGQAIEHRKPMRFVPSESQAADIEEALKIAMEEDGAMSRTEALWAIAIDYRAGRILDHETKVVRETIQ